VTGNGRRPIIGISAYEEEARWNHWVARAALLPATYVGSVEAAGGLPLLIPVQSLSPGDAQRVLDRLDGLILAGGPDVDPGRYGAAPHPSTDAPRSARDEIEAVLGAAATDRQLPTLAICRGFQLLNVVRGGTLHQHLPEVVGHAAHSPTPGSFAEHEVHVEPGSRLAGLVGWESANVPTHHHQAIDQLGAGLVASAWADDDTIEGWEDTSVPFLVGVQWHPEAGEDPSLFEGLVRASVVASGSSSGR
jgi:gamma-glutamyl-gamma-aminobutyrate hydrolase PuuD